MKKIILQCSSPLFLLALIFLLPSCKKENGKQTSTYTIYTPIYKSKSAVMQGINGNPNEAVVHAGKVYVKDNFIYLNDINKGIHIIDNSNPVRPVQIAFLAIPGNIDIAIKGNVLYADMYADLLALDISNPRQAVLRSTVPDFFVGRNYVYNHNVEIGDQIAAEWTEKDTTVEVQDGPVNCIACQFEFNALATSASSGVTKASTGTAGSMAGMVLMNDYLYAITEPHSVGIIDVANAAAPSFHSTFYAGFDLETIYPFEGKLFLGSQTGMFMYDVSNPVQPLPLGTFQHGRACDPVITDGHYAYVTLKGGVFCGGNANELHVLDVRNLNNATLVKTYPMNGPTGLSKDGNLLFVCDASEVKVYNAADPGNLVLLKKIPSASPYDVITMDRRAIVVSEKGLYQYDYSNINVIRQLSVMPVKR